MAEQTRKNVLVREIDTLGVDLWPVGSFGEQLVACSPLGSYRVNYFRSVWLSDFACVVAEIGF
jgi:hypothetical protein